jgi:competence protein ComEC
MALGLGVWVAGPLPRPVLLVAPFGELVAIRGDAGLVPDHPRAAGYVADVWLRRDGDATAQEDAAARPGFEADGPWRNAELGQGWQLWLSRERRVPAALLSARCEPRTVVLVPRARVAAPTGGCLVLDERVLGDNAARTATVARDGALSITVAGGDARLWARQPGVQ